MFVSKSLRNGFYCLYTEFLIVIIYLSLEFFHILIVFEIIVFLKTETEKSL